ncbi:ribonuclease H-like domain-containing protein [Tanacetum coccineum]
MATNEETYDQPLAMTTTNIFEVNHEDAYDSDVDEGPNAAAVFMANLSSTSATNSQVNEVHSNDNQIFDNVDYQLSQEMHQEEHLDSDAETEIDDNTIPYHQYLLDTEAQNVPTEVSADTSDKVSMIAILTDLQTQLDGHAKVNQEKCLEIETLKNELLQCKQEICRLDTHKVKLDLENKVRQEQALVIQRNKRNAELVQENDLLKSTLSGKEKSIAFLQSEKEKILSEKKDLADSYLDEISLTSSWLYGQRAQPALYDADTLLHPTHHPVSIWDSEEVLVHQVVSMKKMNEKPGHVRPANGFYEKLNALMFVPQQELSLDLQAIWPVFKKLIAVFHQLLKVRHCLCEDLRSACDREHTKDLELEAEIFKTEDKQLITESEKMFGHFSSRKNHVCLQLKFQNINSALYTSSSSKAIFEINSTTEGVKPTSFWSQQNVPKRALGIIVLAQLLSANARSSPNCSMLLVLAGGDWQDVYAAIHWLWRLEVAFDSIHVTTANYDMVDLLKGSRTTNLYSISLNDMLSASPVCLLTKASSTKSWLWHRRLNHLNFGTLNELARNNLVRGLPMLKYDKDHLCPSCQLGKSKKASHPLKTENTNTEVLHTLHMDLCGPMRTESIKTKEYVFGYGDTPDLDGQISRSKDEAIHKELGNSLVRAATIASSLEAEHDSGNITKTQSKATPNESSSIGTTSGGGHRVLDLEKTKTTQHNEIASLKKGVKKLEKKNRSRTYKLKRLYKVGLAARVESLIMRKVWMFDVNVLDGEEMFVAEQEVVVKDVNNEVNVVEKVVSTAGDATTVSATTTTVDHITLAQALMEIKNKGKGILIEHVKPMKKKDLIRLDEEVSLKLQAKFNEEERLAKEKAKKEKEANISLIETWDDIQEKIDVDHQLAERLQAQEQEELSIE